MKSVKKIFITFLAVIMVMCPVLSTQASAANVKVTKVTLNTASIKWYVGKTGSFKATVTPSNATNKTLKWKSSNTKVATITNAGKLTAVGVGSAVITCSATDGSKKSAKCNLTVTAKKYVTGVSLNITRVNWAPGKTGKLTATVVPSDASVKTVKWSSSDSSVATVSSTGLITAVSLGKATITCTAADGSGKKATCVVNVTNENLVQSIQLNVSSLNWETGKSGTFKATILPEDAPNKKVKWTTSDSDVVIVNQNGFLKTLKPGTATISCIATDGGEAVGTCKVVVRKGTNYASEYTGSGYLGFNYDNVNECFYSVNNSWQRKMGYCSEYDVFAPFTTMFYDTERIQFQYKNKDWMIQMWKGQYGITVGSEIGVYNKPLNSKVSFYDCVSDEEALYMDSVLYHNNKRLFVRPYDRSWWQTGFVLGTLITDVTDITEANVAKKIDELTMNSTITFPTYEMLDAFVEAFDNQDFNATYWLCGKSITFSWK